MKPKIFKEDLRRAVLEKHQTFSLENLPKNSSENEQVKIQSKIEVVSVIAPKIQENNNKSDGKKDIKVGIVCDRTYQRSLLIENYYYAIKNLYNDVKIVNNDGDLDGIQILFLPNEHFIPHREIWWKPNFIAKCNDNDILVVIIGGEKILNTHYEHNTQMQKSIETFKKYHQYVWDVDDAKILGRRIIGYPMSKHYSKMFNSENKQNKCLFIGQYEHSSYSERKHVLSKINDYIPTDVMSNLNINWMEYLNMYSQYKFSLCPISTYSNGIPTRFYEALLTKCIPILQVRDNTLDYYPEEAKIPECIFFENVEELEEKIKNHKYNICKSELWAEDKMKKMFKEDGIPVV
jgi:hypothetical protein